MYSFDFSKVELRRQGALTIGVDEAGVHTVVPCTEIPGKLRTLLGSAGLSIEASTDSELRSFPHPCGEIVEAIADALGRDIIDGRPDDLSRHDQGLAVPSLRARANIMPEGQLVFPQHSAKAA